MRNFLLSLRLTLTLFVASGAFAWAGPNVLYVTDLEGRDGNIQSLVQQGKLRIVDGKLELVDPDSKLIFGGDLVDRGPHSIQLRRWLVDLKERFPDRVVLLWGNRDLNKLALSQHIAIAERNPPVAYQNWLHEKLRLSHDRLPSDPLAVARMARQINTVANRVLWWTEKNGIPNAVEFHRQEMEKLSGRTVNLEQAADDIARALDPKTGEFMRYLELGQLGHVEGNTLYVHGGVSKENAGVVPGEYDTAKTPQEWIERLNNWGREQLKLFREDISEKRRYANSRLVMYGDAVWDSSVNRVMAMVQSVVYPNRVKQDGNFRLPAEEVIQWLKKSGIEVVVVGHSPVGNVPVPLRADGFLYMHADTSYTDNGAYATVEIKDGVVHVKGITADGTRLDYQVSATSGSGAGWQRGERVVVGFTPDGRAALYRYYDGFKIEEQIVPAEEIRPAELKPPVATINEESLAQQRIVLEAVHKKGIPVVQAVEELDTLFPGKIPVLWSGSSDLSLHTADRGKVRDMVIETLKGLDPAKHVMVTGGTDKGVEGILHEEARMRGFKIIGFSSTHSAPEGFNMAGRIYFAGQNWDEPLQRAIEYVRAKNGFAIFAGGAGVVKRGIEYADELGVRISLNTGIPGAAAEAAKIKPMMAFSTGDQLRRRLTGPAVYARLLRGVRAEDFATMSDDPDRRLVMFMNENGVQDIAGKSGDEVLRHIGYTEAYIKSLKESGHSFRLAVFRADPNSVMPATWDNVLKLVERSYPTEVGAAMRRHLEKLKTTNFADIDRIGPEPLSVVYKSGKSSQHYVTSERIARGNASLWDVRAFLYNELRLSELFRGDGFTYSPDGQRGVAEFIGKNSRLSNYQHLKISELQVSPGTDSCNNGFAALRNSP